ncbi:hypothetical protein [uncultured Salinicola sp.]|uniref:hypothetical protein n=1 Tax=uncultured Salinicola sp. TaxID=1193542 RepID=UPI00262278E8|nr:hypothetical protein [uncultured Salinicola sp.]
MRLPAILILAAALAGCGSQDGDGDAQSPTGTPAAPAQYEPKTPVDKALVEIPPADRRSFQSALRCEIQRNQGDAIQITPEYIKGLQERLEQDPSLADC